MAASTSLPVNANNEAAVQETTQNDAKRTAASQQEAASLEETAQKSNIKLRKLTLASGSNLEKESTIKITPGTNEYNEAQHMLEAEAKAKADAEAKAKADAAAKAAAAAKAKADAEAAAKAKAAAAASAKSSATSTTSSASATSTASTSTSSASTTSGKSYGTFKLSFYDPAVLGSDMGYSGVAANLSVFPKGTKLKITLSDGTVWYRVVNDTGSFAAGSPRQLDVAMPNSQIPSAGILTATVEVVG